MQTKSHIVDIGLHFLLPDLSIFLIISIIIIIYYQKKESCVMSIFSIFVVDTVHYQANKK